MPFYFYHNICYFTTLYVLVLHILLFYHMYCTFASYVLLTSNLFLLYHVGCISGEKIFESYDDVSGLAVDGNHFLLRISFPPLS